MAKDKPIVLPKVEGNIDQDKNNKNTPRSHPVDGGLTLSIRDLCTQEKLL
ncbi:MAG: hypothetical protein OXE59_09855 [Bacteroidetes bacterium]|nr:hypothetical protein [Bacteroidota bacterium]